MDWLPIAIGVGVAVLGWFIASWLAARNDHQAQLRVDRRDAYVGLLIAAQACVDVPNAAAIQAAFEDFPDETVPPDAANAPAEIRDACEQRLESALTVIRLLVPVEPTSTTVETSVPETSAPSSTVSASTTVAAPTTVVDVAGDDESELHLAGEELRGAAERYLDAQINALQLQDEESREDAEERRDDYDRARASFERVASGETLTEQDFWDGWTLLVFWLVVGVVVVLALREWHSWALERKRLRESAGPDQPDAPSEEGDSVPTTGPPA